MEKERAGVENGSMCRRCLIFMGAPVGTMRLCPICTKKAVRELQQDLEQDEKISNRP